MTPTTDVTEDSTELPFEQAYERLQSIANRLNEDEVPVSEMCDLFAEGKGLELALTEFLDTQRERVEAIERGEGIQTFRISRSPASAPSSVDLDADNGFGFDTNDPVPAPPVPPRPVRPPAIGANDDDIPF
jgi:exodeoxyribonuclease VII small subunit